MQAININELSHAIPRYSNTINEPNVGPKYPDIGIYGTLNGGVLHHCED
jgi:hypothetical protein